MVIKMGFKLILVFSENDNPVAALVSVRACFYVRTYMSTCVSVLAYLRVQVCLYAYVRVCGQSKWVILYRCAV